MRHIQWLDWAIEDLEHIRAHIQKENPQAAQEVAQRIITATSRLAKYPKSGRNGRVPGTRELVIPGLRYILPYRITKDAIQILRVFHDAQEY